MATYEFECLSCENRAKVRLSMKDAQSRMNLPCEICKEDTLQKQIVFASPVHFKGGGWPDKEK